MSNTNYKIGLEVEYAIECGNGGICGDYQKEEVLRGLPFYKKIYMDGCREEVVTYPFDEDEFEKVVHEYKKALKNFKIKSVHVNISSDELEQRVLEDAAISMIPPGILYLAEKKPWEFYNEALELPKSRDEIYHKGLVSVRDDTRLNPCVEIRWPRNLEAAKRAFSLFKERVGMRAELPDFGIEEGLNNWYEWVQDWEIFRKEYPKESEWLEKNKEYNRKRYKELVQEEEKLKNIFPERQVGLVRISREIMENLADRESPKTSDGFPFCGGLQHHTALYSITNE